MAYHLLVHYDCHEIANCVDTFYRRIIVLENFLHLEECNDHSNVKKHSCIVNSLQIPDVGVYAEKQGNEH